MTSKPNLSVVMTASNIEGKAASLMESVCLPHEDVSIEYIFVDRGSEDRTLFEVVQTLRNNGIKALTIQNGFGTAASALNTGLYRAGGDYISFVSLRNYGTQVAELLREAIQAGGEYDIVLPVPRAWMDSARVTTGQKALERMTKLNCIPEFGAMLFSKKFLREKDIRLTDMQQMAGLGLELEIRAMAHAKSVLMVPVHFQMIAVRQALVIPSKMEFSCFLRVDAVLRAVEDIRSISGIRPAIVSELLHGYIPKKLWECIEELTASGRGYHAISGYIRTQGYTRFMQRRSINDRDVWRKLFLWRNMSWMYSGKSNKEKIESK